MVKKSAWLAVVVLLFLGMQDPFLPQPFGVKPARKAPPTAEKAGPYDKFIKDAQKKEGLWTLYVKKDKIYAELSEDNFKQEYLVFATLGRGLGIRGLLRGEPLSDEYIVYWRREDDRVQFVMKNIYVRADESSPIAYAVKTGFSDSVMWSFKVEAEDKARKTVLVDLYKALVSDFPGISQYLAQVMGQPYSLSSEGSRVAEVKVFPENIEILSMLAFESNRIGSVDALPDPRNLELGVNLSITLLKDTGFRPRLADPRVGYFIVAVKDFTSDEPRSAFKRYIIRWNLQKEDPSAPISKPKKPLVWWIDRTTPREYRDFVREGVLMWNRAFEAAGFKDAIEVREMPDDADWDPADSRYSVVRWNFSSDISYGGLGPARVNPATGEIIDGDVMIEGDIIRGLRESYRRLVAPRAAHEVAVPFATGSLSKTFRSLNPFFCDYAAASAYEAGLALEALYLRGEAVPPEVPRDFIRQYIISLVAHEIGHVLGLRHNFKASTLLDLKDVHNPEVTRTKGLSSSVMDYLTVNLAPPGGKQGDFYENIIGPYDIFAIRYGYTPIPGAETPEAEVPALNEIAREGPLNHDYAYATDEDTYGDSPDPYANTFDLSSDPIGYAEWRILIARELLGKVYPKALVQGDEFSRLRAMVESLYGMMRSNLLVMARFVGGVEIVRQNFGDNPEQPPMRPIPAELQRRAMDLIEKYMMPDEGFLADPRLINSLAPARWGHWGSFEFTQDRLEFSLRDLIANTRIPVLARLMDPRVLQRLSEGPSRLPAGTPAYTLGEHFDRITRAIWSECPAEPGATVSEISPYRRDLQRAHLDMLIQMALGSRFTVPADARDLSRLHLEQLQSRIRVALASPGSRSLSPEARAHLQASLDRISRALAPQVVTASP
jgi:hypothetical protein